jgi:6-phosphogluconolactonase
MDESSERSEQQIPRRTVLKGSLALAAAAQATGFGTSAEAQSAPLYAYVGSFTSKDRKARGDGINVYRVDPATGGWTHVQQVGDLVNPSFLALDRDKRHLYSVHADLTDVSAFSVDKETGKLTFVNRRSMGGKNAVHLALDPTGRFLVTGNYSAGTVTLLPIEKDGSLGPLADTALLGGAPGPHRAEQGSSHPHHAPFDPSGRFVLVPDKGLDRVFVFRVDAAAGRLVPNDPPSVQTRAGAGPRHVDFHPTLPIAYVINELDSTITTYSWNKDRGELKPLQIVPTLPTSFTGDSTASELQVAPSGKTVYGSNRGHDSIVVLSVDPTSGLLTPIQWEPTQGSVPRFFTLDPAAKFLYAANEQGDTIVTFGVDPASGKLTPTGQVVKNASPACIVFAG